MTRLAVNLLLVLGLLFSQLAAAPHVHGGEVHHAAPHNARPHFHLHRFLPVALPEAPEPAPARDHAPRVGHECPCDHDADACYLPDNASETGRAQGEIDAKPLPAILTGPSAPDRALAGWAAHTPDDVRPPGCPLYIQHLALLN
jgi:hypothetical protein